MHNTKSCTLFSRGLVSARSTSSTKPFAQDGAETRRPFKRTLVKLKDDVGLTFNAFFGSLQCLCPPEILLDDFLRAFKTPGGLGFTIIGPIITNRCGKVTTLRLLSSVFIKMVLVCSCMSGAGMPTHSAGTSPLPDRGGFEAKSTFSSPIEINSLEDGLKGGLTSLTSRTFEHGGKCECHKTLFFEEALPAVPGKRGDGHGGNI